MNLVTSRIPSRVCSVLMDLAQIYKPLNSESLEYSDIIEFGDFRTDEELKEVQELIDELLDLDFRFEDDEDAIIVAEKIVELVQKYSK